MVEFLNSKISVKQVMALLLSICGIMAGAITLTDWAEHRASNDEALITQVAKDVGEIKTAVVSETASVAAMDKALGIEQTAQEAWETRVTKLESWVEALAQQMQHSATPMRRGG